MSPRRAHHLAIRKYSQALRFCPDFAEAYAQRALSYYLSRPIWLNVWRGPGKRAVADARRALACQPAEPRLYHLISLALPPWEQVTALREGMEKAGEDHPYRLLLWHRIAEALWRVREFAACARELESLTRVYGPEADLFANSRRLLCWTYEALGDYSRAVGTYREVLNTYFDSDAPTPPTREADDLGAGDVEPEADGSDLLDDVRLQAVAGLTRNLMRSEDFDGALAVLEEWRPYLPEERVPINVAVLEVLAGGSPAIVPELLPVVATCAAQDHYYGFFAGILFAHAGQSTRANRYLRRFRRTSEKEAAIWGRREQWERDRAESLVKSLRERKGAFGRQ